MVVRSDKVLRCKPILVSKVTGLRFPGFLFNTWTRGTGIAQYIEAGKQPGPGFPRVGLYESAPVSLKGKGNYV